MQDKEYTVAKEEKGAPFSKTITKEKFLFESPFYSDDISKKEPKYDYLRLVEITNQGYVCVAKERRTGELVAVKMAIKELMRQKKTVKGSPTNEDFAKECKLFKIISPSHQGIAKWIDEWETEDQKYLALEFFPDGCLHDFVVNVFKRNTSLAYKTSPEQTNQLMTNDKVYRRFEVIQSIFSQMVSVVEHLHRKLKMCHMDISLANFMVIINDNDRLNPVIKLIDFGVTLDFSQETEEEKKEFMHNTCLGKFTYQSPECYHCKKLQRSYDCRLNDRYGLGICLYALLVGTFPYKSPSDHDSNASELLKDGMMSFLKKENFCIWSTKKRLSCWTI